MSLSVKDVICSSLREPLFSTRNRDPLLVLPLLEFSLYLSVDVGVWLPWTHIIHIILIRLLYTFPAISYQFLVRGKSKLTISSHETDCIGYFCLCCLPILIFIDFSLDVYFTL